MRDFTVKLLWHLCSQGNLGAENLVLVCRLIVPLQSVDLPLCHQNMWFTCSLCERPSSKCSCNAHLLQVARKTLICTAGMSMTITFGAGAVIRGSVNVTQNTGNRDSNPGQGWRAKTLLAVKPKALKDTLAQAACTIRWYIVIPPC